MKISIVIITILVIGSQMDAHAQEGQRFKISGGPTQEQAEWGGRLIQYFENRKTTGLRIYGIAPGGKCDQRGLRNADIVTRINGQSILDSKQYTISDVCDSTKAASLELKDGRKIVFGNNQSRDADAKQ